MVLLHRETRCGVDEIRHDGAVAVFDQSGFHSYGEVTAPLPLRSTAKPFILAGLLDNVLGQEEFTNPELALMSSSHNGEPQHVATLLDLLRRYNISPELLHCGQHDKWREWSIPSPLGNNCSGKHAAFLIATKVAGLEFNDYRNPDGPLFQAALSGLKAAYGKAPFSIGIDGCSMPTCTYTLEAIARTFRAYAMDDLGPSCAKVRTAHRLAGYYVAGTDRLDSHLLTNYGFALKSGSDGLLALGVPGLDLGIAVKAWSGSEASVQAVVLDILHRRRILNLDADLYLKSYHTKIKTSLLGSEVGTIQVCFREHLRP